MARPQSSPNFGGLFQRSEGSLTLTLEDVLAGDEHTVGVQSNHAERAGRILDQRVLILFTLRDGKVAEAQEFADDTAANAELWS